MRASDIMIAVKPFADAARAALKAAEATLKRLNADPEESAEASQSSLRALRDATKLLAVLTETLEAIQAPMSEEQRAKDRALAAREIKALQKRLETNLNVPFLLEWIGPPRQVTVRFAAEPDELTSRYLKKLAKGRTIGPIKVIIDETLRR